MSKNGRGDSDGRGGGKNGGKQTNPSAGSSKNSNPSGAGRGNNPSKSGAAPSSRSPARQSLSGAAGEVSAKRQLLAEIEALPENVTLEEATENLYRLYKLRLALKQAERPATDLSRHQGVLNLTEDALAFQARLRGEWS